MAHTAAVSVKICSTAKMLNEPHARNTVNHKHQADQHISSMCASSLFVFNLTTLFLHQMSRKGDLKSPTGLARCACVLAAIAFSGHVEMYRHAGFSFTAYVSTEENKS